jgi:hypothetical protein
MDHTKTLKKWVLWTSAGTFKYMLNDTVNGFILKLSKFILFRTLKHMNRMNGEDMDYLNKSFLITVID